MGMRAVVLQPSHLLSTTSLTNYPVKKILLIEDDMLLRNMYAIRLVAESYDITTANDGEEGLAKAITESPDLILSDIMMPHVSGFEMIRVLKETPATADIPVIFLTALSDPEGKKKSIELGADEYFVKSEVTIDQLAVEVHKFLDGRPDRDTLLAV